MNIRSARKLEQSIGQWIANNRIVTYATISTFDQNPIETFNQQQLAVQAAILLRNNLMNIRSSIRRAIQFSNEKSGINSKIAERNDILNEITAINELLASIDRAPAPVGNVEQFLKAKQTSLRSAEYSSNDTFHIRVIDDATVAGIKTQLTKLKRDLRKTDDELLTLNSTSQLDIQFTPVQTALLTELGLI